MKPEVEERLKWLADKHGLPLSPHTVVEDAKDPSSPLHGEFEWDIHKAAMQHWLGRARELIRSVKVEVTSRKTSIEVQYFIRDPETDAGYTTLVELRSSRSRAIEALKMEFLTIRGHLQRAQGIAKALGLTPTYRRLVSQLESVELEVKELEFKELDESG